MSVGYPWAKLWCDSFEGDSFQNAFSNGDLESPILFLLLLCKAKSVGDGHGKLSIPTKRVQKILGWNFQRLSRVHTQLCSNFVGTISGTISEQTYEVFLHNFSKFQENRGGKREAKVEQKGGRREKREERSKMLEERSKNNIQPKVANAPSSVSQIRNCFLENFKKRYGYDYPQWGAKENGQAATWLKSISLGRALELIPAYLGWNKPFFVERGHPFGLLIASTPQLVTDINSVRSKESSKKAFVEAVKGAVESDERKVRNEQLLREFSRESFNNNSGQSRSLRKEVSHGASSRVPQRVGEMVREGAEVYDESGEAF